MQDSKRTKRKTAYLLLMVVAATVYLAAFGLSRAGDVALVFVVSLALTSILYQTGVLEGSA